MKEEKKKEARMIYIGVMEEEKYRKARMIVM